MKPINHQLTSGMFTEKDIISRYTRAEAIEDGALTDITPIAKEAGFKFPVALSAGVSNLVNEAVEKGGKNYNGVVWDILMLLLFKIKASGGDSSRCDFSVNIWSKFTHKDKEVKMYSVIGAGDTPEPVITIMLPNED